jgi:TRAP-type C4-dicarboxylate transport system substrate-binding protein
MQVIACRVLVSLFAVGIASAGLAQEVALKVHHPLPTSSTAHQQVLTPWCEKLGRESKGRLQCQIYPSMQLGGSVPQLYDQVRDGVVDVIWTIPGYAAGRFPRSEVFELPFMIRGAEGASRAVWDYVRQYAAEEFGDVKPLAFHVHAGGVFHMVRKPIVRSADLRGQKVRAPTRQTNRLIAALGATPVGMPVPQVAEALSKGVIDGALLPYEVVPAIKADELTRFHSEPDPSQPVIYTSVFILAMNKAKYESLPAELKKVIDANSGIELSAQIGRIFADAEVANRKRIPADTINVIPDEVVAQWQAASQPVVDAWIKEISARGGDGRALLESARRLLARYSK